MSKYEFTISAPAALESLPQESLLLAGVGVADITPPPGIPKGGYSAMSKTATGFRTRLKAKAFYLKPDGQEPILLLQVDLHSGTATLRNRVAELVALRTDIPNHAVCLTCTHTHAGPGQLSESDFYNDHISNKPGFDPALFDFIAGQIAAAALAAFEDRRPAKIASGRIEIWGATRNRSLAAYQKNQHLLGDQTIYEAINPYLYMLRIDQQLESGEYKPRGAFSTFSIHGTSVPVSVTCFNADVWAYVERGVEHKVAQDYGLEKPFIHGPAQGTHGDIAPNIRKGAAGFQESRRLGSMIAEYAVTLFKTLDTKLTDSVNLSAGLREVDLYETPSIDGVEISHRPVVGNALTAGAYENSTPILYHTPFFKHGPTSSRWLFTQGHQGHKRWVGSILQPLVLKRDAFPHKLLFQIIQINQLVVVAAPFEVTVEAGRRIACSVEEAIKSRPSKQPLDQGLLVCVTSLANGYTGYTTTPEEYSKQYYEGGHTLYGPNSTPYLCSQYGALARDLLVAGRVSDIPSQWQYCLRAKSFWPESKSCTNNAKLAPSGEPTFIPAQKNREAYWECDFQGPAPADLKFHERLIEVQAQPKPGHWDTAVKDGILINDEGCDLAIKYKGVQKGADNTSTHTYALRWYNPDIAAIAFRFCFTDSATGQYAYSQAFA